MSGGVDIYMKMMKLREVSPSRLDFLNLPQILLYWIDRIVAFHYLLCRLGEESLRRVEFPVQIFFS